MEEIVTIPLSEYQILKSGVAFINCLKMCGVENWSEYHNALVMFGGLLEDEVDVDVDIDEENLDESEDDYMYQDIGYDDSEDCDCCSNEYENAVQLSEELGNDVSEILNTMQEFKSTFKEFNDEQLLNITRTATIMSNVSELNNQETV